MFFCEKIHLFISVETNPHRRYHAFRLWGRPRHTPAPQIKHTSRRGRGHKLKRARFYTNTKSVLSLLLLQKTASLLIGILVCSLLRLLLANALNTSRFRTRLGAFCALMSGGRCAELDPPTATTTRKANLN